MGKDKRPRNYRRILSLRRRDGDLCHICQLPMIFEYQPGGGSINPLAATVDHLQPQRYGGCMKMWNLKLAHDKCNNKRGSKQLKEIYKYSCTVQYQESI